MPHQLHIFLRDIRVEHGELLKGMADKLGMGSAELSAIEHGRKPIPEGFMQKLEYLYDLNC